MKLYLLSMLDGVSCGAYSSKEKLSKAVDTFKLKFPHHPLVYQCWKLDQPSEAIDWDWCYIPSSYDPRMLIMEHSIVPNSSFFGKNLVGVNWEPYI